MAMHYKDDGGLTTAHYAVLKRGMPLEEAILRSTWAPARETRHEELGSLSVGAAADVAVLRVEERAHEGDPEAGMRADGSRWAPGVGPERDYAGGLGGLGKYLAQGDARWDGTLGGEVRRRKQGELSSPWLVVGIWWLCEKGY